MSTINIKELPEYIKIYTENKTPIFLHGTIGIGKSMVINQTMKEIARLKGMKFVEGNPENDKEFGFQDIRASNYGPEDIKGLPFKNGNEWVKWLKPEFFPKQGTSGIIFFDELNLAPQSVQSACYQLILDRKIGNNKLPEGWTIIAAGNTDKDGAAIHRMPAPLKNRFAHLNLEVPSVDEYTEFAIKNEFKPSIISYLNFKNSPSIIHGYKENIKGDAFPTPRTWHMANDIIKNVKNEEIEEKILGSFVGEGIASEYIAYKRLSDKVSIKKLINKPKEIKKIKERGVIYSVVGALMEEYKKDKTKLGTILEIGSYLEPEMMVILVRMMNNCHKDFKEKALKSKEFINKMYPKVEEYIM